MPDENPKKVEIDKVQARRLALLAKTKATSEALEKSKKTLTSFDTAVKSCPDE